MRIETRLEEQKTRQCIQCNSRYFGIYNISSDTCINSYQNFYFFVAIIAMFILLAFGIYRKDECTQCRIALQVLDELIAEKEESNTVQTEQKQYKCHYCNQK